MTKRLKATAAPPTVFEELHRHRSLIRLAAPGQSRPVWIVPKSTECASGCGRRIEPAEFRLRLKLGGRNRDYHKDCAERLGVRL